MKRKFLKPKTADLIIRRPDKAYEIMPASGAYVPTEGPHWKYYFKRIKDGSLIEAKPPKPPKPPKKTKAAAPEG